MYCNSMVQGQAMICLGWAWAIEDPAGLRGLSINKGHSLRDTPPGVPEKRAGHLIIYSYIYDTSTPSQFEVPQLVTKRKQLLKSRQRLVGRGAAGSVLKIQKIIAAYM